MKLLLVVVCAVCPHIVLPRPSTQLRRDLLAYPYEVASPDGHRTPVKNVLYSYSVDNNPYNANLRHYGQNPAFPNIDAEFTNHRRTAFNKAHVQAFPLAREPQVSWVFTADAKIYEKDQLDFGEVPLRSAVESIPIEAEVYSHLRNPDENSNNLQFNREGVESLPFFPTPYRTVGFNDVDVNAFVVEATNVESGDQQSGNLDQVVNRASSVESHSIVARSVDPDDAPGQVQIIARPYAELIPDINYEENVVHAGKNCKNGSCVPNQSYPKSKRAIGDCDAAGMVCCKLGKGYSIKDYKMKRIGLGKVKKQNNYGERVKKPNNRNKGVNLDVPEVAIDTSPEEVLQEDSEALVVTVDEEEVNKVNKEEKQRNAKNNSKNKMIKQ